MGAAQQPVLINSGNIRQVPVFFRSKLWLKRATLNYECCSVCAAS